MADAKDKLQYIFNPFTGNFDAISKFNADRIVTNSLNAAGHPRYTYDAVSDTHIEDGATVVIDNAGNVVVV